ncbi:hypothetical protein [uncultured Prevotella sp.]|uniref:hypothetical protein n=1 Tax=uncultured Prevotella sp. TaxID=159272 RepID=UPI0026DDA7B1|nr:hypothetical protein [uncultured Prevotella sp.]
MKDQIVESVGEATNINLASLGKSGGSSSTKGEHNHDKQIYGVRSLTVAFNGSKYAVSFKDDDEKHQTPYIYDNIMAMSQYHVATSQIQADGTVLYGVITGGWHFHDTGCEYKSVEFFDDEVLLLVDEDDDQYTINSRGELMLLEKYMKALQERIAEDEEDEDEYSDDSNDFDDSDDEDDSSSALSTGLKVTGKIAGGGLKLMGKLFD